MIISAKFLCLENARKLYTQKVSHRVALAPVMAAEGEDSVFGKLTPSGSWNLDLLGAQHARAFEPGVRYYLFLVPVAPGLTTSDWLHGDRPWANDPRMDASQAYLLGAWGVSRRVTHEGTGSHRQWDLTLTPVKERCAGLFDTEFPCAALQMTILNPEAARELQHGHEYRLVFVPERARPA